MKHISIIGFFIALFGLGLATTSCEDMLTPDMDRYNEGFSGRDTVNFYLGILRNVQDMVEQNELAGDLRSDLVTTTSYSTNEISDIINFRRQPDGENQYLNRAAYYKVINQCNYYLAKADTNALKNNVFYMRREYAQVVAIRAWTYLQLVQTYGRVPFITKPVESANTGWESNPEAWADANNLVDLLKGELEKAKAFEHIYGGPQYGNFNTGSVQINSKFMRFYNDLVLADLYLLRGASKNDYIQAAKNYYYFVREQAKAGVNVRNGSRAMYRRNEENNKPGVYTYPPLIGDWVVNGLAPSGLVYENLTVIPSAANSSFGRVLSMSSAVCGFDAHSSNSTSESTGSEGESNTTTTGSINLTVNYRHRQIEPSKAYLNLCFAQNYSDPKEGESLTDVIYYEGQSDARLHASAPMFKTKEGEGRFITKYAPTQDVNNSGYARGVQFKYYKSLYRLKQVYLRFAEAVNRAGYPRLAFSILRNGISFDKTPGVLDSLRHDDVNKISYKVYYIDSLRTAEACNYLGADELRRAAADPEFASYLDFTETFWENDGIHEQGNGKSCYLDSLFSYRKTVSARIKDEAERTGSMSPEVQAVIDRLLAEQVQLPQTGGAEAASVKARAGEEPGEGEETPAEPDRSDYTVVDPEPAVASPLEINAVETLIADEMALETAFEGTRMFDLIRFARHKDNDTSEFFGGLYGTEWLAWKIARRNTELAPYENPGQFDNGLYGLLLNPENWYLASPVY